MCVFFVPCCVLILLQCVCVCVIDSYTYYVRQVISEILLCTVDSVLIKCVIYLNHGYEYITVPSGYRIV
jgi:hypothetical protein